MPPLSSCCVHRSGLANGDINWTGLHRADNHNPWIWQDGSPLDITMWREDVTIPGRTGREGGSIQTGWKLKETDLGIQSRGSGSRILWDHRSAHVIWRIDPNGCYICHCFLPRDPLGHRCTTYNSPGAPLDPTTPCPLCREVPTLNFSSQEHDWDSGYSVKSASCCHWFTWKQLVVSPESRPEWKQIMRGFINWLSRRRLRLAKSSPVHQITPETKFDFFAKYKRVILRFLSFWSTYSAVGS